MAKRKVSTGLKLPNSKTIYVGDVLKFTPTESTLQDFHDHPLGKVLSETGYKSIYMTIEKHKWLELDLNAFIMGTQDKLAERGLVLHIAGGGSKDDFDHEYKDVAPMLYSEALMDTTFLRFMLDQGLDVEKVEDFDIILSESEEFYVNIAREIYMINEQVEAEEAEAENGEAA